MNPKRTLIPIVAALASAVLLGPAPAHAGGRLDAPAMLDGPSPYPGYFLARSVPQFHDHRCMPAPYVIDTSVDPLPNPLGPPFLSATDAAGAIQAAAASWNDIPTSFIELDLQPGTTGAGTNYFQTFDTVNEIHFRVPPGLRRAIGSSPTVTLAADMTLTAGTDIDGDGDPDVATGIATCTDVDGDGDREWPEGFYEAGMILDNDIWLNAPGFRFTVDAADADNLAYSVDLQAVATHELGHSVGLAHSLLNQLSPTDGTGATMAPGVNTVDPVNELSLRTLEWDDVSWASLIYPEGTESSGPAALQAGDVAFDQVFGLLSGEVRHGVLDHPVAGASVSAVDRETGETVATTFSGSTVRLLQRPGDL